MVKELEQIKNDTCAALCELFEVARVKAGQICVIGCSSSEISGGVIGKASSPEIAEAVFAGAREAAEKFGVYIAAQCCEHLNRAIITERAAVRCAIDAGVIAPVNVVPQPKAGGSFATAAYRNFADPVALESLKCDCGIDIGATLIGMHLKEVAVPVRLSVKRIGEACVTAARVRAKFIGGERAVYDAELM